MGELLETAKIMVQPAMKLLEMCGNAIGTIYEPRHIRKMTDAEVYRIKQLGSAIAETDSLPIVYDNGAISMNTIDFEDFAKRAELRANYQMLREQNNIESVVGKAYQEVLNAPEVPNDPVDEDWAARFFSIVKKINTEEMQYIWSKILAGEIAQPGSFSMRTLEAIRNLSQSEAIVFQKVIPLVMLYGEQGFISSDDDLLKKYGIYYADMLLLQECGLVSLSLSNNPEISKTQDSFLYSDSVLMKLWGNTDKAQRVTFGVHLLTSAGRELYNILSHNGNKAYAIEWAERIFGKNKSKMQIMLYEVNGISHNAVNHCTEPFRVLKNETA